VLAACDAIQLMVKKEDLSNLGAREIKEKVSNLLGVQNP